MLTAWVRRVECTPAHCTRHPTLQLAVWDFSTSGSTSHITKYESSTTSGNFTSTANPHTQNRCHWVDIPNNYVRCHGEWGYRTLTLDGSEWSASHLSHLSPVETSAGSCWQGLDTSLSVIPAAVMPELWELSLPPLTCPLEHPAVSTCLQVPQAPAPRPPPPALSGQPP
jgi:hypothetical protein